MAEIVEIDGICYNIVTKGQFAEVSRTISCSGDISIPGTVVYQGVEYNVTSIADKAFYGIEGITSVTIDGGVTSIGESAFQWCRLLSTVTILDGLTSIGVKAFYGCGNLTSVTIPNSVTSIGSEAFCDCSILTTVTIPNGITTIDVGTFRNCKGLTSVIIPSSVTSISSGAFNSCSSLTSVTIPNSVTSIGGGAFANCSSLADLTIPNSVTSIGGSAFESCTSLTSVIIPNSVTSLGDYAFSRCSGLTSVSIPNSLTSIGSCMFEGCNSVTSVTIPDGVTSIGEGAFQGCSSLATITIPSSVTSIGNGAFSRCSNLTSVTIPNGVTAIGTRTFSGCYKLTSVTIPNSVTSIGTYAFMDCANLASITIPNSVTSIGVSAFEECSSLDSVTISNSVTSIDNSAFYGCKSLTSVTIPNSVKTIGRTAFWSCTKLSVIKLGKSIQTISQYAFAYCENLTDVVCLAKRVPYASADAFDKSYIEYATLHVYESAIDSYKAETPWSSFQSIVAADIPTFTLTYKVDGEVYKTVQYEEGQIIIPEDSPQKEGYIFSGWSDIPKAMPAEDVTVTGTFTKYEIAINETNFPDINFRNWLLSQEYGKDGVLTDEEISDITEINVEKKDIANLQGIEKFTSLTSLYCSINELTTLDLSGCPQLNALDCSFNKQLTSINLSGCKALQHLYCHGCKLTAIDLTDCTELIYLDCGTNLLTTIDPSPCKKVMSFVCSGNQLTTIDISVCKALRSFDCQENQLTTLDCSGLTELQAILCAMNALTSINISGCSKLLHLLCEFNNLGLDAFQHIMTNIPERDESDEAFMFVYSESTIEGSYDHTPDHNLCSNEQVAIAKAKGWVVYYENNTGDSLPYEGVEVTPDIAYRPFIEDGKVWKVGHVLTDKISGAQIVSYLYFDGDTIVNGQTAKRMLRDRVAAKEWESQNIEREYVGALYEKDKKVYCMNVYDNDFELLYDFSLNVGDTINLYDFIVYGDDGIRGVVTKRATGGLYGFKGNYLDIQATWEDKYWSEEDMMEIPVVYNQINHWLEGVGSDYPPLNPRFISFMSPFMTGGIGHVLMSCSIGDEVIYFDDQYEDGTTTQGEAKKRRFDFTHTVKIQPKTPSRREEEAALHGEYTDRLLDIDLNPLVEAYSVCITNQNGQTLYEKNINARNIVALNIDISKYPEGQYEITIDNSNETFNGVFDTTTGINEIIHNSQFIMHNDAIFNLQGQRINRLQKGLNIVGGKKILVK